VPARGLHGEPYRGHVFWDELFVFRALCLRDRKSAGACSATGTAGSTPPAAPPPPSAKPAPCSPGCRAATAARRTSGSTSTLTPANGHPTRPHSLQRHIGLAVAYDVWQYWQATGDRQFLEQYGAEIIVEVARFFASLTGYDHREDRYVIRGVVGPDEFHTRYPGATRPGIDNNAYTNVMAVWTLLRAVDALAALAPDRRDDLRERLGLHGGETHRWDDISRRMLVPFHHGVISQFEGYERLAELDWAGLRARHGDIRRLDRILGAEGDDPNRYQASKQADALMLFYLLSADELRDTLDRLGYRLDPDTIPRTVDYYLDRTTHGSTLSAVVHAWVLARGHRDQAPDQFVHGLEADIRDVHGGTTAEGIHLGAMAGSIDTIERCFGGVETRDGILSGSTRSGHRSSAPWNSTSPTSATSSGSRSPAHRPPSPRSPATPRSPSAAAGRSAASNPGHTLTLR